MMEKNPMTEDKMNEALPTVLHWIAIKQAQCGLSDADLAVTAGLTDQVLRVLKEGKIKLPAKFVKGIAKAVGADPREFFEVWLSDYEPAVLELITDIRMPLELTDNERELLKRYRTLAQGNDAVPVIVSGITLVFPKSR